MSKTVLDLRNEAISHYNTGNNTYLMFPPGTRVKVITPCQDFCFFYGETGTVIRNGNRYLSIIVKFDEVRHYQDGSTMSEWNFKPSDLIRIFDKPHISCIDNPWINAAMRYANAER